MIVWLSRGRVLFVVMQWDILALYRSFVVNLTLKTSCNLRHPRPLVNSYLLVNNYLSTHIWPVWPCFWANELHLTFLSEEARRRHNSYEEEDEKWEEEEEEGGSRGRGGRRGRGGKGRKERKKCIESKVIYFRLALLRPRRVTGWPRRCLGYLKQLKRLVCLPLSLFFHFDFLALQSNWSKSNRNPPITDRKTRSFHVNFFYICWQFWGIHL